MLGKVLAAKRIFTNLKLLNELIARYPDFAAQQVTLLAEMTRPYMAAEVNYCSALRNEQATGMRQLNVLGRAP